MLSCRQMTSRNELPPLSASIREQLVSIVGPSGILQHPSDLEPLTVAWRGQMRGEADFAVLPASAEQVSQVVRVCSRAGVPVVPQGGNTGLSGGALAPAGSVILAMRRMNRVRTINLSGDCITVEAGCVLAEVQRVADAHDRLFPLCLAAEGSCQIGGNLSTNAGGVHVLRYGNIRDLTLGLEVALADGTILEELTSLRKDNRGYDLKQLFIGSEGTLGIITAATLKLFPKYRGRAVALAALSSLEAAVSLLAQVRMDAGESLTAFELVTQSGIDMVVRQIPGAFTPLESNKDWLVVIELAGSSAGFSYTEAIEGILAKALENELIVDAVVAQSEQQSRNIWCLRENISEAMRREAFVLGHDISVPIEHIAHFIQGTTDALMKIMPALRVIPFGHVGDGNIHFNLGNPSGMTVDNFLLKADDLSSAVYDFAARFHGSFSAEHGIGLSKVEELQSRRSAVSLELMHTIKAALDPQGILNPGKVLRQGLP